MKNSDSNNRIIKMPKRFICITLCATLLGACDQPLLQSAEQLKADARKAIEAKNFSNAASLAQHCVEKSSEGYECHFLLAQGKAQVGDKNAALVALEQAIKNGLKDDEQITGNANLDPIKAMSAYTDLMNSSFPNHKSRDGNISITSTQIEAGANVSIRESGGKQVLRAGDIVIEVPATK